MDFLIKFNDRKNTYDRAEFVSDIMLAPVRMAFGRLFEDFKEENISLKWRVIGLLTIGFLLPLVLISTVIGLIINQFSETHASKSLHLETLHKDYRDIHTSLIES